MLINACIGQYTIYDSRTKYQILGDLTCDPRQSLSLTLGSPLVAFVVKSELNVNRGWILGGPYCVFRGEGSVCPSARILLLSSECYSHLNN